MSRLLRHLESIEVDFEEDVRIRANLKLAMLGFPFGYFPGMTKVADYSPKAKARYFHKLASIYIEISLLELNLSVMEKDAAWDMALENMARMGKLTKQEMQNLVQQGKIRSDRLFMDDLKRELLKEMDRVGGIVVDGNNTDTIERAVHKLFLYIKGSNSKERMINAKNYINKLLNVKDEIGEPIEAYSDNLYDWLKRDKLLREEFLTDKTVGQIPVAVVRKNSHRPMRLYSHNTPEMGTIPAFMDRINGRTPVNLNFEPNSADFKVDYGKYLSQNTQNMPSQKALKGIGIVGIDRNARQQNLESLAHEVYEATDWNPINLSQSKENVDNIKDLRNAIDAKMKKKLKDTHRSQVVIAKELGLNHRLYGSDGISQYNPIRNYRSLQFNKLPPKVNRNFSPIGEHLGLVKTNTTIPQTDNNVDYKMFDSIGFNRLFRPKIIGMPNMAYEEFIANAIRSRRNTRIQILKELGYEPELLDWIE